MGNTELIKKARERAASIKDAMKSSAAQFFVSTEQRNIAIDTAELLLDLAIALESRG